MAESAAVKAFSNIALVKYWGKLLVAGNEPAVSSLSITLDSLFTETKISLDSGFEKDILLFNGEELNTESKNFKRIFKAFNVMRDFADVEDKCIIETSNNFPTGAGLASSASGFSALALGGSKALGLDLSDKQLSQLARSFSGSAARSIFGGFSKMMTQDVAEANPPFGSVYAEPVATADHWPLSVCVGVVSEKEKDLGSTDGMDLTRLTSPYYEAWLRDNDKDVLEAEQAVLDKDFEKLAIISEQSCLKMHANAMAANPGILYWEGVTVEAIHLIRSLRKQGVPVFFTIDAGPQIKAVCLPEVIAHVEGALQSLDGIKRTITCGLGQGAHSV